MRVCLLIISLFIISSNYSQAMDTTIGTVKQWKLISCDSCQKPHIFIQGITEGKSEVRICLSSTNPDKFEGVNILLVEFPLAPALAAKLAEKSGLKQALLNVHNKVRLK